jgi:DNA-binding GntR family transcriptional regulator
VNFRNGWEIRQLDFGQLDALYELRVLLEQTSVRRMKSLSSEALKKILSPLDKVWQVPVSKRFKDADTVAKMDEEFHCGLVAASGNMEFARAHLEVTEKIRIVRRLDFTISSRITATYEDHLIILKALHERAFRRVEDLLATHIEVSRLQARAVTLLRL